jgi:hypothetical protein
MDKANMSSSMAAELLEGQVAALSHFSELEADLELLGSGRDAVLTKD